MIDFKPRTTVYPYVYNNIPNNEVFVQSINRGILKENHI